MSVMRRQPVLLSKTEGPKAPRLRDERLSEIRIPFLGRLALWVLVQPRRLASFGPLLEQARLPKSVLQWLLFQRLWVLLERFPCWLARETLTGTRGPGSVQVLEALFARLLRQSNCRLLPVQPFLARLPLPRFCPLLQTLPWGQRLRLSRVAAPASLRSPSCRLRTRSHDLGG